MAISETFLVYQNESRFQVFCLSIIFWFLEITDFYRNEVDGVLGNIGDLLQNVTELAATAKRLANNLKKLENRYGNPLRNKFNNKVCPRLMQCVGECTAAPEAGGCGDDEAKNCGEKSSWCCPIITTTTTTTPAPTTPERKLPSTFRQESHFNSIE